MYAEFVSRDDMKNLKLSTERPPQNVDALKRLRLPQNTLYVSKKSAVIALVDYKTSNMYGPQRFEFSEKVSKLIWEYIKLNKLLETSGTLFGKSGMSTFVGNMLDTIGQPRGNEGAINVLRKSYYLHENRKRWVRRPGNSLDAYLDRQKIDTSFAKTSILPSSIAQTCAFARGTQAPGPAPWGCGARGGFFVFFAQHTRQCFEGVRNRSTPSPSSKQSCSTTQRFARCASTLASCGHSRRGRPAPIFGARRIVNKIVVVNCERRGFVWWRKRGIGEIGEITPFRKKHRAGNSRQNSSRVAAPGVSRDGPNVPHQVGVFHARAQDTTVERRGGSCPAERR